MIICELRIKNILLRVAEAHFMQKAMNNKPQQTIVGFEKKYKCLYV